MPLLIPEVNHEHLGLVGHTTSKQRRATRLHSYESKLLDHHAGAGAGAAASQIRSRERSCDYDAGLSGAGYPGVASLAISDNVLPFIEGEEEKIEQETLKILGEFKGAGNRRGADGGKRAVPSRGGQRRAPRGGAREFSANCRT